jgi:hypothetical protein
MIWIYFRHKLLRLHLFEFQGVLPVLFAETSYCVRVKRQILVDITTRGTRDPWTRSPLAACIAARPVQTVNLSLGNNIEPWSHPFVIPLMNVREEVGLTVASGGRQGGEYGLKQWRGPGMPVITGMSDDAGSVFDRAIVAADRSAGGKGESGKRRT